MTTYIVITYAALATILWAWAILDIAKSYFHNRSLKRTWLFIVILFPVLGSVIYFQLKKRLSENPRIFNPDFGSAEKNNV